MKQNKYDDPVFFEKYNQMDRSVMGLSGAGEWATLEKMLPDFAGKRVLDLGCGFGWHCQYAMSRGAKSAVGIDISERMLERARALNSYDGVEYIQMPIEEIHYGENSFDIVLSSLAFHYVNSFHDMAAKIRQCIAPGGDFIFSVEHPVFTAQGPQQWVYDDNGKIDHFPVDNYFYEGSRNATFLGEDVIKYHKTITTYVHALLSSDFEITDLAEPAPDADLIARVPAMHDELRRPMMLIIAARAK